MTNAKVDLFIISKALEAVRETQPLVHCITNFVTMEIMANTLLAIGASPVMAHAAEEMEEMSELSSALLINIGTLETPWVESMKRAAECAKERSHPIVLDPVGCGATQYRTQTTIEIVQEFSPDVIKGNASEILSLYAAMAGLKNTQKTKGVDSQSPSDQAVEAALDLSSRTHSVIVITGQQDYVVDSSHCVFLVKNGDPILKRVTGTGCISGAIIAACCAVEPNTSLAALTGIVISSLSGELAAKKAQGPGSFHKEFLDTLYKLNNNQIGDWAKIENPK